MLRKLAATSVQKFFLINTKDTKMEDHNQVNEAKLKRANGQKVLKPQHPLFRSKKKVQTNSVASHLKDI